MSIPFKVIVLSFQILLRATVAFLAIAILFISGESSYVLVKTAPRPGG